MKRAKRFSLSLFPLSRTELREQRGWRWSRAQRMFPAAFSLSSNSQLEILAVFSQAASAAGLCSPAGQISSCLPKAAQVY